MPTHSSFLAIRASLMDWTSKPSRSNSSMCFNFSFQTGAAELLQQLGLPDDLLDHSVGLFFLQQILFVPVHAHSFDGFDDGIWVRGLYLPTAEGVPEETASDQGSNHEDYTCVEGRDVISGKEGRTDEHAEKRELDAFPGDFTSSTTWILVSIEKDVFGIDSLVLVLIRSGVSSCVYHLLPLKLVREGALRL